MIVRYGMFPNALNEKEEDSYIRALRDNFTQTLCLVGIKKLELERLTANDISKGAIKNLEFHEFATEGIRTYAEMIIGHIIDGFSTLGIAKVEVQYTDDEAKSYKKMWQETTDDVIDKNAADEILSKTQEADILRMEEEDRKNALSNGSTHESTPGLNNSKNYDNSLAQLYMSIADMLPVEGRDYKLNPSPNENGGIHMDPEAYTQIGKIWLDYLADALPKYASLTPAERNKMLEAKAENEDKS